MTLTYGAWSKPHHGNFCDHYATTADGLRCERCGATRVASQPVYGGSRARTLDKRRTPMTHPPVDTAADEYWPADYGTPVVAPEPVPCASTHDWHALAERGLDWYQGMTCADCGALYTYERRKVATIERDASVPVGQGWTNGDNGPMTTYTAGWNMAGYLPETDPEVFDTIKDAHAYLLETAEQWADQDADMEGAFILFSFDVSEHYVDGWYGDIHLWAQPTDEEIEIAPAR